MAKVYSWEVSKSPKKYAYIVNPKDLTNAYVGTELKGNYLEIVKDWAANCSDEEYEVQFQKMLALCAKKGYNVEFETASAYMNVTSTCDNLRGPAGRGIDYIALQSTDEFTKISKYIIYYDDETTDTFEIKNGKDGRDGIDGEPGAKGDAGISSKLIMIYTSGMDEYGNTFTPSRPKSTDGKYDFVRNKFENCPNGWFTSDTDANGEQLTPPIWMSSRIFASSADSTDKEWALPIQITGDTGAPGVDGVTTEFIYYLDDAEPMVDNLPSLNEPGYVPPSDTGWTASPTGVDEDHLTEWCSLRKINRETKEWGPWEKPFIWSKYGVNGQDGDGVQYMYLKNAGAILENPTPIDYLTNADYQNKNTEWIPENKVSYINIDSKLVSYDAIEEVEGDAIPAGVWTDNPSDLTSTYHSQWVSSRKYRKNPDTGKMEWGPFSAPALWARYGQDGKNATSVRKLYALSTSTSDAPTLPSDSTTTGDWGTGFPLDYQVGVNVVWGTEAEIWAHNSEFVMAYKIASGRNADGEVIAPSDITATNFKDVESIPNDKVEGYDYLRFNGDYYKWSGGWCQPYLVTGLKGESGYAPNYTTYVFAYAYTNHVPGAPTSKSPTLPGVSLDELGNTIYWLDFPDTTNGRIDGAIDPITGKKQRWYQCIGHVYGHNNEVYEWGAVTPCSGQDGIVGTNGNYTEIRFGVTKDTTKPSLIQSNNGVIYREPELYDANGIRIGWFVTDEELPDIPEGGAMWQIWATINGDDDSVMEVGGKYWNGPKRISGERGEQGTPGPAGMRGATGLPGATSIQMYCLGTYGKNENSECYWQTGGINGGDGYFGSPNWKDGVLQNEMDGWFTAKDMPYSDILTARNLNDLEHLSNQSVNKGRVVKLIETSQTNVGPTGSESTFNQTTYTFWLINSDTSYTQLTQPLNTDEDFNVYVWCIQGNEKWEVGALSEEVNGDEVEHRLVGIEWGSPFKLQGTNGLRGLTGTRGQVVYPMGVYNQEEVYITTEDKAPYVYDSNDGMYYVYNNTEIPWVGVLPGYDPETKKQGDLYKTIMVHPNDAETSVLDTNSDPTVYQAEEVTTHKYLRYNGNYYIWNGTKYTMASRYKYSIDGSGAENTWMTSQHGDSPANNYANATNSFNKPAWERFESFKALYTSIGIIENGMIGSAVYNNEFMFSQQGYKQDGVTPTNYAVVSGTSTEYGFLSAYEYDEDGERDSDGVPTGRHWKYRGDTKYINNTDVNPYEKNAEGKYIHTFLPNVCINFSTGQMWASAGKNHFNYNGTGYLAGEAIKWWFDNNNKVAVQIGKDGDDGIRFEDNTLTIGPLNAYKKDLDNLQEQIDKKAETYYQETNPSTDWTDRETKAQHVGDLWYCTENQKTSSGTLLYEKGATYIYQYLSNQDTYAWSKCSIPEEVFDRIDGKASIFTSQPSSYQKNDLWILSGQTNVNGTLYKQGEILTANASSDKYIASHWEKKCCYIDNSVVSAATSGLEKDIATLKTSFGNVVQLGSAISNYIGVKGKPNSSDEEEYITGCLNGSELGQEEHSISIGTGTRKYYNKLIFAAGIPNETQNTGSNDLSSDMKKAKVRIYEDGKAIFDTVEANLINGSSGRFNGQSGYSLNVSKTNGGTVAYFKGSNDMTVSIIERPSNTSNDHIGVQINKTTTGIQINDVTTGIQIKNATTTAIECTKGVFAGLRPKITYITSGSYDLTDLDHTIVLKNSSTAAADAIDINLPSSPQDGQEYIIYQVKKGGKFNVISSESNGKAIFSMNGNKTTYKDEYVANANRYVHIIYCNGLKQWISRFIDYAKD